MADLTVPAGANDSGPPKGEGYDLQRVYSEKLRPFWFRWEDRWWKLPHLKMLDFEVQDQVESLDVGETSKEDINHLFDVLMGDEQSARWRTVVRPLPMLLDMLRQWVSHSGGVQGEAQASDDSSKSTGRPSKRTSSGSTGSASPRRSPAKKTAKAATPPVSS